jgi:DNA polymerase III alpha subunit
VHLHNHTEYSMLDGAAKITPMLAEAQRLEMPAIGMTDHGKRVRLSPRRADWISRKGRC